MQYLVQIDLSGNRLSDSLLIEPPPHNLQLLDLSRNQITNTADLSVHKFLTKLNLDRNLLKQINGLNTCQNLRHLSISRNGLTRIDSLKYLPLKTLDVSWNRIVTLDGIETLDRLEELNLYINT
jgi:Leucine Rich repeat